MASPTPICFRPTNMPMPWSTWTTRSPTFRSRRSERNALLRRSRAPLRRAALLLEDVGLGVDLQAGVRQPEAARQRADRDEHRRVRARPRRARPARRSTSYSFSSSTVRSARPGGRRDEQRPCRRRRERARISATQSATRPWNSQRRLAATCDAACAVDSPAVDAQRSVRRDAARPSRPADRRPVGTSSAAGGGSRRRLLGRAPMRAPRSCAASCSTSLLDRARRPRRARTR